MKASLDCLSCVAIQALRAARIATDDEKLQREIVEKSVAQIPDADLDDSPAWLSLPLYHIVAEVSGNPDPYKELRHQQNESALKMEPELRKIVNDSSDPLITALHLAAAGNIIDLGTQHEIDIDVMGAIRDVLNDSFAIDHTDAFINSLNKAKTLIYLLDNAGEIVFDKILIEELAKKVKVTAVVKGGPIINDAIREDAEQIGLTNICKVIDNGGAFVGSPLQHVPESFLEVLKSADIIIGKGQGNYETVDDFSGDVFLILRAKCEVIARHMGVELGQVALISTQLRNKH